MTVSRRDRVRAATIDEIKATALSLLVSQGPSGATFRAVARSMGMAVSGLYRYFDSHEELLAALVLDAQERLAVQLEAAAALAPADQPVLRLTLVSQAFRDWAAEHPREFALIFTTRPRSDETEGTAETDDTEDADGTHGTHGTPPLTRYSAAFATAYFDVWQAQPFPVPPDDALPPDLVAQLAGYRGALAAVLGDGALHLPLGSIYVFLRCWTQLFGLVALDAHGHLAFCLTDPVPFFHAIMTDLGNEMGIRP